MAISKVVYKSSANATPVTWMDATPATALAADIMAPKTAMLADGVLTTGTGSGGGGGLEYETGTYTPSEDIARPTINFANSHTNPPISIIITDVTGTADTTTYTNYVFSWNDYYQIGNEGIPYSSTKNRYAMASYIYRNTSTGSITYGLIMIETLFTDTSDSDSTCYRYWVTNTLFKPYSNSNSRYWRSGRTYKWLAVWAPTT